ncbi:hypothetical protein BGZ97_003724 [Linnemannia gamsii]|uniref:Uncharacterized protein n=1 Tax=Linnemannia gamsii TaxID=64522 RepID=A0A9P6QSZ3_9FUNG|nr:hypothetical protein BGZ97_003724 [Linnemannia gamsii]
MQPWSAPRSFNPSFFAKFPAHKWEFNHFATYSLEKGEITTALEAKHAWKAGLGNIANSEWTPQDVVAHAERLEMEPDGEISNVVQQMFALRSVEVVASASERAAKGTLSKVKSARSASKKAEDLAESSLHHNNSDDRNRKRHKCPAPWTAHARKLWKDIKVFNLALSSDRDALSNVALESIRSELRLHHLDRDALDDLEEALNAFQHLTSIETLTDVLKEHYPRMKGLGGSVKSQELAYIWRAFDTMMDIWERPASTNGWREGWYASNIHGPLLSIIKSIGDTEYRMTDIKSKALDPYKEDMRHDALLSHTGLKIDLVVMEAKPHSQLAGRRADLKKVEKAMIANLRLLQRRLPDDDPHRIAEMRTFGILCSGYTISFLEARVDSGAYLIYVVGKTEIPIQASMSFKLVDTVRAAISFKRRIQASVNCVLHARSISSLNSSTGSSGSILA